MQSARTTVAEQLKSVANRYRQPYVWLRRSAECVYSPAREDRDGPREDDGLGRLEAVLFLAREPLNSRKLGQLAELADGTQARTMVRELNRQYDEARRAFRVEEIAGGYQLLTRPQFAPWLRRFGRVRPELRLSAPAMETLAVIAYRQPVLRADIEAIRGVSCGEILRQLMERNLVRIDSRSEELGRPYLYGTTSQFLQTFGLRSLDQLPRADKLRGTTIVNTPIANAQQVDSNSSDESSIEKEKEVTVTISDQTRRDEELEQQAAGQVPATAAAGDGDDYEDDYDEDLDEEDDFEEDDEDYDEDFDEDYEDDYDDEWEEVEDEDDDWDDEDEEDWEDDDEEEWD